MDDRTAPEKLRRLAPIRSASVAVEAAKALRNEILRRADDDMFLGSEDELVHQLGISRPTFRQAARLLEYEELLVIRRGAGGGYFGRRPSAEVVAKMAGVVLLAQGATFEEVLRAQYALDAAALAELVANPDPAVRGRPAEFLETLAALRPPYVTPEAIRAINLFWRELASLVANRALLLFLRASQAYAAKSLGLSFNAARLDVYVSSLREMCAALRDGDGERAIRISAARGEAMIAWAREDCGQ